MSAKSEFVDDGDHAFNLFCGRIGLHYDEHLFFSIKGSVHLKMR
jgi:hypothetical protein